MQIQILYILDNRGGPSIQTGLSQKKTVFTFAASFGQWFLSFSYLFMKKNTIPSATYH